ncbi:MAG: (2Fe-2S) ferredoxin domain-containing protein [Verrucomicrobia bacterium]|nr:(2Fe-2S) ferredoxin domain-containing protein [Verrucomicrobiota bacterium]
MSAKYDELASITVCMGSSCFARGNGDNLEVIEQYLAENNVRARVELTGSRCEGLCAEGPNLIVNGRPFQKVDRGMLLDLLREVCPTTESTYE